MIFLKKTIQTNYFVIGIYISIIFIFYFLIPWIKNGTIFFFRWDEAPYLYISQKIQESGYIPSKLNYVGGFPNYIYPALYLLLSINFILAGGIFSLEASSFVLQLLLFFTISTSSLVLYKLVNIICKNFLTAFFAGLFYIILPIVSYRLFYLHATFYANFVGMLFLLLFLFYLVKYRIETKKKFLYLSIFFYSTTLFTHQLVFMMSSILLGIDFFIRIITKENLLKEVGEKTIFVTFAIVMNFNYILKTPILEKIFSVLGIAKYEQFGKEMVTKSSADLLPPIVPDIFLWLSIAGVLYIIIKKLRGFYSIAFYHLFLISPLLLNKINISLPASFRYDTFYIITIPILLSCFLSVIRKTEIKIFSVIFLIYIFSIQTSKITNAFYLQELYSLKRGLSTLQCVNTVSFFRIAPWIPALSRSSIYYAHVDIYNAHQDKMNESMIMFSNQEDLNKRLALIKERQVDCIVYEKNILIIDGIRVKGWETSRYNDLYPVSRKYFEDKNLVIFKF